MKNKLKKFCIKNGVKFTQLSKDTISVAESDVPEDLMEKFKNIFDNPHKGKKRTEFNFELDKSEVEELELFCVKITDDNNPVLSAIHNAFHEGMGGNLENGHYILSDFKFSHCLSSNNPDGFTRKKYTEVDTETFLRLIGKTPLPAHGNFESLFNGKSYESEEINRLVTQAEQPDWKEKSDALITYIEVLSKQLRDNYYLNHNNQILEKMVMSIVKLNHSSGWDIKEFSKFMKSLPS